MRRRRCRPASHRQAEAIVVVSVLADDVDASGSGPDAVGSAADVLSEEVTGAACAILSRPRRADRGGLGIRREGVSCLRHKWLLCPSKPLSVRKTVPPLPTMATARWALRSLIMFTYSKIAGRGVTLPRREPMVPRGGGAHNAVTALVMTERTTPHNAVGDAHQRGIR